MKVEKIEERDLYDINHRRTGQTVKVGDPIPAGCYVQVVMVFIQNSSGHYLIQKRAKARNGMYATTGGHPVAGQTSLQGMVAEIKEELGVDVNPVDLKLFYSGRSDEEQVFFDDYYLKANIPLSKLKLQKSEVRLRGSDTNIGVSKALNQRLRVNVWLHLRQRYMSRSVVRKEKKNTAPKKAMNGMAAHR